MPYIQQEHREKLDDQIFNLTKAMLENAEQRECRQGVLNYVITKIALNLIDNTPSYSKINDVVGALECCKLELYRRLAAPYENLKAKQNGDLPFPIMPNQ